MKKLGKHNLKKPDDNSCKNDDKCTGDVSYEYNYDQEIELSQHTSSSKNMSKISYSDLVKKAKELVSVVQNDQSLMQSTFTFLSESMGKFVVIVMLKLKLFPDLLMMYLL